MTGPLQLQHSAAEPPVEENEAQLAARLDLRQILLKHDRAHASSCWKRGSCPKANAASMRHVRSVKGRAVPARMRTVIPDEGGSVLLVLL